MVPHTSHLQRTATADRRFSLDFAVFEAYLCMLPGDCFQACHTTAGVNDCRFWRYVRRYSRVNRAKKMEDFKKYIYDERKITL